MQYDYETAHGSHLGGKGRKAPYETKLMRVPLPLESLFEEIIATYRETGFRPEGKDIFPNDWQHSFECKKLRDTAYNERTSK